MPCSKLEYSDKEDHKSTMMIDINVVSPGSLQLPKFPTQREFLHMRCHVSWVRLQRTSSRSSNRSTSDAGQASTSAHPAATRTAHTSPQGLNFSVRINTAIKTCSAVAENLRDAPYCWEMLLPRRAEMQYIPPASPLSRIRSGCR